MPKKEKKQKTRFKEGLDPTGGWGNATAQDDPWSVSPSKNNWGQADESGLALDGGGELNNAATAGGVGPTSWGQTQPTTWTGTPQNDLDITKTLQRSITPVNHGPRTSLSQDHSAILDALSSNPGTQKVPPSQQQHRQKGIPTRKSQQNMQHQQQYGTTPNKWDDIPEEDEDELEYVDDEPWAYPDNQSQYQQGHGPSPRPSPSKTLSNALGSPAVGKPLSPATPQSHRLIESNGAALDSAFRALYSKDRLAKERFHWYFSPDKDERVQSVLQWIQAMSEGVGALGLQKFLQTGERGALFVNADFRPLQSPKEPAFDWLPIGHLEDTLDKILQESVAFYDPATQVIVFVFLLSKSGNSMAIWRRKIPVAEMFREMYAGVIDETVTNLKGDYPVYVDELPPKIKPTKHRRVLSKRKWWKPWMLKSEP